MIDVQHLTKQFGDFVAVNDLTFSAQPGEIVGFLGPNGAGKTTTLRILSGFMPPTAGTACVAGFDVVRELRSLRPALRVAIVSGHVNERLIAEATALGVTDVLGKQDSMDALGDAIRALLPLPGAA